MYNKLCFDDGSALVKARSYTRVRAEVDKRKPATTPEHTPVRVIDRRPDEAALPGLATKPGSRRVFLCPEQSRPQVAQGIRSKTHTHARRNTQKNAKTKPGGRKRTQKGVKCGGKRGGGFLFAIIRQNQNFFLSLLILYIVLFHV